MRIWTDIFNGPHVHFFQHLPSYVDEVVFTARQYHPIPALLRLYGVRAKVLGKHGGKDLYRKLIVSSRRVILISEYVRSRGVNLAIHKHSVEAARVAWGLGIPSISFIDNELMVPQNMLVCPLSNVLIAPMAIDQYVLRNFTPSHVSILQFDGVSEVANVYDHKPDEGVLKKLNLSARRPIVVFRGGPLLAAYSNGMKLEGALIKRLRQAIPDAQIVQVGREGENHLSGPPVFDARSLFCYADLVISGGGTMTREAALLRGNAITYFEKPLAVDRYLARHRLLQMFPGKEILDVDWRKQIRRKTRKKQVSDFEHPFELLEKAQRLIHLRNGRV